MLSIFGKVIAKLSAGVSCHIHGSGAQVEGGKQTICTSPQTAQEWCDFYGARVENGIATLYKAVDDNFKSPHGTYYTPGTIPVAPDWDGGKKECGLGLHFCATPRAAQAEYFAEATKFVGCPVALSDIAVHHGGTCPDKVKARGCCGPVWECDEDGEPIEAAMKEAGG